MLPSTDNDLFGLTVKKENIDSIAYLYTATVSLVSVPQMQFRCTQEYIKILQRLLEDELPKINMLKNGIDWIALNYLGYEKSHMRFFPALQNTTVSSDSKAESVKNNTPLKPG